MWRIKDGFCWGADQGQIIVGWQCLPPQTPTLLLTPSPLLSNIHFWSTLSPVAPLSPATRRQGAHLFQVSTLEHTYLSMCLHVYIPQTRPNTPFCSVPVSVCPHPSVPDPCAQYGWDQHSWSHFTRPSEDIGLTPLQHLDPDSQNPPPPQKKIFLSFLIILVLSSSLSQNSHYNQTCGGRIWRDVGSPGLTEEGNTCSLFLGIDTLQMLSCTRTHWCHRSLCTHGFIMCGFLEFSVATNSKEGGISMAAVGVCGLDPQQWQSASSLDRQSSGIAEYWIFPFMEFLSFVVQQCCCWKRHLFSF